MNDLVSIIMPSYNTGKYISASIQSVINQTYSNWELIIIDDCSTDDTDLVVKAFLSDKRIRYYKNTINSGAALCRNKAINLANGKWIAFLDSDDIWLPDKLSDQIHFMELNNYHFSYTNYSEINSHGDRTGVSVTGPKVISKAGFMCYCWPGCLTVMYDSEKIGLIQIENIKKNNDYALWLKICRFENCYLLDKELALYRRGRVGSISTSHYATLISWHYKLFRVAEHMNPLNASLHTAINMVFGIIKKVLFVKTNQDMINQNVF